MLIEGARRVGKSTIVREFSKTYASSLIIDFSTKGIDDIIDIFEHHSVDLDDFFFQLEIATKSKFVERNTLIVFDEVQNYPYARQMIKYLVEDGRYDYIETGSLISIRRNVKDIQIPSEERHLEMHP